MGVCFKEKQCCCKNSFCLVEEWFYSENIGGIVDDSLLEANRAIVIYLHPLWKKVENRKMTNNML